MELGKIINENYEKYRGKAIDGANYLKGIEMPKLSLRNAALTAAAIVALATGRAKATIVDWSVPFQNDLAGYVDGFTPGVAPDALDGHDFVYDIMQPPGSPSGPYIQWFSVVDSYALTQDIKSPIPLYGTKTWETTLAVVNGPLSGTNEIIWALDGLDEPGNEIPCLIDYGTDATRTTPIATIDMRAQNSYSFDVSNVNGAYRYIDFEVQNVPEASTIAMLGLGSLALLKRRRQYQKHR